MLKTNKIINPEYSYSDNLNTIINTLNNITDTAAFDFETASKYSNEKHINSLNNFKNNTYHIEDYKPAYVTGLSSPEETIMTHLGIANKIDYGFVIIISNDKIRDTILDYLINTDILQIWHNPIFDFRYIYYYKKKFPKKFIDTRLYNKSLKNNTNHFLGNASLKLLMRKDYGEWEKERVSFTKENMYNEKLIKYTAIDVCATYKLWRDNV